MIVVETFEELAGIVATSVDGGLIVLGSGSRQTLYEQLRKRYRLSAADIPGNLQQFHDALVALLGQKSTGIIERLIAKRIYGQIGLIFSLHSDWTLIEYVNHAREKTNSARE